MSVNDTGNLLSVEVATPLTWLAPELAVIVPTFNEAGNVELLYKKLATALSGISWEMIVVDDNSPDGTSTLVKDLARAHSNLRCIRRIGRRGLASACIEGVLSTAAPYVAVIDADHQHDERILPKMLEAAKLGADIVVGSRYSGHGSASDGLSSVRLRGSQLATKISELVIGQTVSDPMSGFFLLRRETVETVAPKLSSEGFKILLDLIMSARTAGKPLRLAEVPYAFRQRHAGESKMNPLVVVQFLGLVLSKLSGGILPTSFLLFGLVGALGVVVHMGILWFAHSHLQASFLVAQLAATVVAMTSNFAINNELTYANKRLRGWEWLRGLGTFYAICSIGALANISVSTWIYGVDHRYWLAGLTGVLMSVVFNYSVSRTLTWR